MTHSVSCKESVSSLRAILGGVAEPTPDIVAHWKDCPHCNLVLQSVLRELEGLEATTEVPVPSEVSQAMLKKGEAEVRRQQRRRLILVASLALLVAIVTTALGLTGVVSEVWAFVVVLVISSIALSVVALMVARLPQRWGLYRRLGSGRQLGGVCLGLAERTHTSSLFWRLAFLVSIIFMGGYGITIYLLLLMVMPVHPDDRQYLLRFRLAHWWRGRKGQQVTA